MTKCLQWEIAFASVVTALLLWLSLDGYPVELSPGKASAAASSPSSHQTASTKLPVGSASTPHKAYLPLLVSGRPDAVSPVTTIAADVTDENNNERMAFVAGDTVRTHVLVSNSVSSTITVRGDWRVVNEAGVQVDALHWSGDIDVSPGSAWRYAGGTIPAGTPLGPYTFIGSITHNGETSTQTGGFFIASALRVADDFSNPSNGWPAGDTAEYAYGYKNGEYSILFKSADIVIHLPGPNTYSGDFAMEADVRRMALTSDAYGLMYGMTDDGGQFDALFVDRDGNFNISRYTGEDWQDVLPWDSGSRVRSGQDVNHLAVARRGTDIFAYANGRLIARVSDPQLPAAGWQGLIAETWQANAEVRFDNFRFYDTGGQASPVNKPAIQRVDVGEVPTRRASPVGSPRGQWEAQDNRGIPRLPVESP